MNDCKIEYLTRSESTLSKCIPHIDTELTTHALIYNIANDYKLPDSIINSNTSDLYKFQYMCTNFNELHNKIGVSIYCTNNDLYKSSLQYLIMSFINDRSSYLRKIVADKQPDLLLYISNKYHDMHGNLRDVDLFVIYEKNELNLLVQLMKESSVFTNESTSYDIASINNKDVMIFGIEKAQKTKLSIMPLRLMYINSDEIYNNKNISRLYMENNVLYQITSLIRIEEPLFLSEDKNINENNVILIDDTI